MKKIRYDRLIIALIILIGIVVGIFFVIKSLFKKKDVLMISLNNLNVEEIKKYADDNKLTLNIIEKNNKLEKGKIVSQSIAEGTKIKKGDMLEVVISKGIDYEKLNVDELGYVPIMMYHGIHDITDNKYTGGNIDYDGYQRTAKAFREDLEFYYKNGYRMIRLEDYVNGKIDVEAGYSPIILTFDDGLDNNILVTGLDEKGNIKIDPNSAVGILNEFREKYPDFNVTATFFVNGSLFNQKDYDEKILNYLVENNYDIGNHTWSHVDFTDATISETNEEVGSVYELLDKYIPGKYVSIVALPYGSPYRRSHETYDYILNSEYKGKKYETIAALRVGWEAEVSPFDKDFNKTFLKRIRAYDNNGEDFDIEMNFERLKKYKYISDGDINTVVIPEKEKEYLGDTNLEVIVY